MERLQDEKVATEAALKAALARKREALIGSALGSGTGTGAGDIKASAAGARAGLGSRSASGLPGSLQGASKAAWEKAIMEDEMAQPLKISSDMLLKLTEEERDAEKRLQSELSTHMHQLKQLRHRIQERDGASASIAPGGSFITASGAGAMHPATGPGSVAARSAAAGGGGSGNIARLEALERRITQLEAGLAGKVPLTVSAPPSRMGTAAGPDHPGHAHDGGVGMYFGDPAVSGADAGTGSPSTPMRGAARPRRLPGSGEGAVPAGLGASASASAFSSLPRDVPLAVALMAGGGFGGKSLPRLPPPVTSAMSGGRGGGSTLPAVSSAPVMGLVFKRERVRPGPGQPLHTQYSVLRAPGGAFAGGSALGSLPEYQGLSPGSPGDGRGWEGGEGGYGADFDPEAGGGGDDAIDQWLEAKAQQAARAHAGAGVHGPPGAGGKTRAGPAGASSSGRFTGPSPYAPAGIAHLMPRSRSQPAIGGASSSAALSRSVGPSGQRGGGASRLGVSGTGPGRPTPGASSGLASSGGGGAFRPVPQQQQRGAGSRLGGGAGSTSAPALPMSEAIGRQRMQQSLKSGGPRFNSSAAGRGGATGGGGAAGGPGGASGARQGARAAVKSATLAQFRDIRTRFEASKGGGGGAPGAGTAGPGRLGASGAGGLGSGSASAFSSPAARGRAPVRGGPPAGAASTGFGAGRSPAGAMRQTGGSSGPRPPAQSAFGPGRGISTSTGPGGRIVPAGGGPRISAPQPRGLSNSRAPGGGTHSLPALGGPAARPGAGPVRPQAQVSIPSRTVVYSSTPAGRGSGPAAGGRTGPGTAGAGAVLRSSGPSLPVLALPRAGGKPAGSGGPYGAPVR
jgi:hypothetical protein